MRAAMPRAAPRPAGSAPATAPQAGARTGDEIPVGGERRPLLILGLGEPSRGDEGLGVTAIAELERLYAIPDGVEVMAGGALDPPMLHRLLAAGEIILVEAVRADGAAGELLRLHDEEIAPAAAARPGSDRIDVAQLIDRLRWLGCGPLRVSLLGLVSATREPDSPPSPGVQRALPALVEAIAEEARTLGHALVPLSTAAAPDEGRLLAGPRGPAA